ncbi:hypothetical protein IE53DRAFT_296762, partial [Violaceomyces palustris]
QPLDHFDGSTDVKFNQRYFYSLRHYVPSSKRKDKGPVPVFVLDSGETSAVNRIPYLDHGILDILAEATGGIGVVLEHRYYGTSVPDRSKLGPGSVWGVDQLRWLNNRQALQDSAEFVKNVRFEGVEEADARRIIYYGGSYPGARAAHMRVLYPDLIYGAIASSAVVAAVDEFPEYFYPIARGAEPSCSQAIQSAIGYIDKIIAPNPRTGSVQPERDVAKARELLSLFGLGDLSSFTDFANLLTAPLGSFQALNWDPQVSSPEFARFCSALTQNGTVTHGSPRATTNVERDQIFFSASSDVEIPPEVAGYASFMKQNYVEPCLNGEGEGGEDDATESPKKRSADECFSSDLGNFLNQTELDDNKAWTFQVCTTWGYLMTSPPVPSLGDHPGSERPSGPKLISTLLDYDYAHAVCKEGYQPGEHFEIPARPNVTEVNSIGGFGIEMDRLAFIDGQYDPWRPATVHSEEFAMGGARSDTLDRPFKLIADCWHHCDENGNKDGTVVPPRVKAIHKQEVEFVKHWLSQ